MNLRKLVSFFKSNRIPPSVMSSIKSQAWKIVDSPVESITVFDDSGRVIWSKSGVSESVDYSVNELKMSLNKYTLHNHPQIRTSEFRENPPNVYKRKDSKYFWGMGQSFSPYDVATVCLKQSKGDFLITRDPKGVVWFFILLPGVSGFPTDQKRSRMTWERLYSSLDRGIKKSFEFSWEKEQVLTHEVMVEWARIFKCQYSRERF